MNDAAPPLEACRGSGILLVLGAGNRCALPASVMGEMLGSEDNLRPSPVLGLSGGETSSPYMEVVRRGSILGLRWFCNIVECVYCEQFV